MYRIYQATNKVNGKKYIGKETGRPFTRKSGHIHDAFGPRQSTRPLCKALREFGKDAFEWVILQECASNKEANALEIKYITEVNTLVPFGYNALTGGAYGIKWTVDQIKTEALKYNRRSDWKAGHLGTYKCANKLGILDSCCEHMIIIQKNWTESEVITEARKHKSLSSWQKSSSGSYKAAIRLGIFDKCKAHIPPVRAPFTKEEILTIAAQYTSMSEFTANYTSAAQAAFNMGLSKTLFKPRERQRPLQYKDIFCKTNGKKYESINELCSELGFSQTVVRSKFRYGKTTHKGYVFSYQKGLKYEKITSEEKPATV